VPNRPPDDPSLVASSPPKNRAAAELGRRGGQKGGAIRAARMTQEERSESAREAATMRWARVQPEGGADEATRRGGRPPKPFIFVLLPEEAREITEANGTGGHQSLHRRLVAELERGGLTIVLSDKQLGELIRYMTQYESGGFQGRLRRAFERSLRELLIL
jgi:hypothetical protein